MLIHLIGATCWSLGGLGVGYTMVQAMLSSQNGPYGEIALRQDDSP